MMRQQQHPESEDFMLEEEDTAHPQHRRSVAPANSLSKKLQRNKDAAAGHVKKSPLFHHVPPGSPSSHNNVMDSKKLLRIRTRINHIED